MTYYLNEEEKELINKTSVTVLNIIHELTLIRFVVENGQVVAIEF